MEENGILSPEMVGRIKARERKRRQRAREKSGEAARDTELEREWWAANRATLPPETLQAMVERNNYCRDLTEDMEAVRKGLFPNGAPIDDEFIADVVGETKADVSEHGVTHLGYITRDDDIPYDWSTKQYWQDSALLKKLEDENWQTSQYVKFGLLAALPDWKVKAFLTHMGWTFQQAADLLGYRVNESTNRVSYQ